MSTPSIPGMAKKTAPPPPPGMATSKSSSVASKKKEKPQKELKLDADHIATLKTIFTLLDTDMDGTLDDNQLRTAVAAVGVDPTLRLLREMKLSVPAWVGDGVDFDTFVQVIEKWLRNEPVDWDKLMEAFRTFDASPETGFITDKELRHLLSGVVTCGKSHLTEAEVDEIFHELAIGSHQNIDYDQYIRAVSSGFVRFV